MISIVVAVAEKGVIGARGKIPWQGKMKADMAHFVGLTMHHTVIMGRKTWQSLGKKFQPLSGRRNIVISTNPRFVAQGAEVVASLTEAYSRVGDDNAFVIGGARVYEQALPDASIVHLTRIYGQFAHGDTFFSELDPSEWVLQAKTEHLPDEENHYGYDFETYLRR